MVAVPRGTITPRLLLQHGDRTAPSLKGPTSCLKRTKIVKLVDLYLCTGTQCMCCAGAPRTGVNSGVSRVPGQAAHHHVNRRAWRGALDTQLGQHKSGSRDCAARTRARAQNALPWTTPELGCPATFVTPGKLEVDEPATILLASALWDDRYVRRHVHSTGCLPPVHLRRATRC